jgi:hypothetical protein
MGKALHFLCFCIIVLGLVASGMGLFYQTEGEPYEFTNQYGDLVKMYGKGLYANDSYFRAPIFRGTDFTIFFIVCPLMIFSLIFDMIKSNVRSRLFLTALIGVMAYYATNVAFGVTYNFMMLVYIFLFGTTFYSSILAMKTIDNQQVAEGIESPLPYNSLYVFLVITGIALFGAWMPDIVEAWIENRPLLLIESYTTEITYVLDMGIIAPLAFVVLYLLRKREGIAYVLLDILLTLAIVIGIMVPIQTAFQLHQNIELPIEALITKIGIFVFLGAFAIFFKAKLYNSFGEEQSLQADHT